MWSSYFCFKFTRGTSLTNCTFDFLLYYRNFYWFFMLLSLEGQKQVQLKRTFLEFLTVLTLDCYIHHRKFFITVYNEYISKMSDIMIEEVKNPSKEYKVDQDNELRVEADSNCSGLKLELLEGRGEIFGSELVIAK